MRQNDIKMHYRLEKNQNQTKVPNISKIYQKLIKNYVIYFIINILNIGKLGFKGFDRVVQVGKVG